MSYRKFFEMLTGHLPYGFQEDLGLRILGGESLVFRAPTGSGKTWATVAPFLFSLQKGARIADRLIYALPLRSLASSLHSTVFEALQKLGPVERSAKDREYPTETTFCSLQIGGEKNDPFFEGDLIFCTIDQVLSGYLMMPLSLPDRLANIVAGALPGIKTLFWHINSLGKRGSLWQCTGVNIVSGFLAASFSGTLQSGELRHPEKSGLIQVLDDFGDALCEAKDGFDRISTYGDGTMKLGTHRILVTTALPYKMKSAGKRFTWYQRIA